MITPHIQTPRTGESSAPEFALHVDKIQTRRSNLCRFAQLLFRSVNCTSRRIHTWHIVAGNPYRITLFQEGSRNLSFEITRDSGTVNSGDIAPHAGLTVSQMSNFLKKCEVVLECVQGNYYPVFVTKPVYVWKSPKNEVRLLRTEHELIAQVVDENCRFQTTVDSIPATAERVSYLVNKCLMKVEDTKTVSFFQIEHQWKWRCEFIKESYEVSLVTRDTRLFWYVMETTSTRETWNEFKPQEELWRPLKALFKMNISEEGEYLYNFNCVADCCSCASATKKMMLAYRKKDEVIKLLKDFKFSFIRENPLELTMEPAITCRSQIEVKQYVSKFSYAVSIIFGPKGPGGNHAKLIVEGVRDDQDLEPQQKHNIKPGDYFMHDSELLDENKIGTKYRVEPPRFHKRTRIWMCPAEKVKEMIDKIHKAQENPIRFSITGKDGYNCFTWAKSMIVRNLAVQPQEVSFWEMSLGTHVLSLVAIPGKRFGRSPEEFKDVASDNHL